MKILEDLRETEKQILAFYKLSAETMLKNYGEGKWNIRQILIHLADAEAVLLERIKRTISEENPSVIGYDPDLWEAKLSYSTFPLDLSKEMFSVNRKNICLLAETHYEKNAQRTNTHSVVGLKTLKDEFDKVIWHSRGHIDQIKLALKS